MRKVKANLVKTDHVAARENSHAGRKDAADFNAAWRKYALIDYV